MNQFKYSTLVLAPLLLYCFKTSSQNESIDRLFEASDVIVQGKVIRMFHFIEDEGATFLYSFAIDSIFKGEPRHTSRDSVEPPILTLTYHHGIKLDSIQEPGSPFMFSQW